MWMLLAALPLVSQVGSEVSGQALRPGSQPATAAPSAQSSPAANTSEFFEASVRPVLAANCYDCHADQRMGGLRLDSREALLKGGRSGAALVPGDPDKSLIIQAVLQTSDTLKMPKGGRLRPDEIAALTEWVRAGAPWFNTAAPTATTTAAEPSAAASVAPAAPAYVIKPEQRAFWSFQPLGHAPAPAVSHTSWAKSDIDRFILARLENDGLTPVRAADKRTLIRRATLDLTGLPPTPEEIDAFEHDSAPDAFARVVDRLLASPRYGEAWGRMWLDVARYGEDDYRSLDPKGRGLNPYPNAYLYRDWVIKAFNDDMPYDQFVRAQLAGDLLKDDSARARTLPGLGFMGLGPWYYDNGAVEITRADERHDRVDAVSRGMLGLTVGCARCHDHKYDPIPTKDYYSLAGVFLNTEYHEYPLAPKAVVEEWKAKEKQLKQKREMLREFTMVEGQQLAETLAFQASKYIKAAWQVAGEPKKDKLEILNKEKLDYELFERWLAFLSKRPVFYPFLKDWQSLIDRGGTAKEADTLATAFQELLVGVLLEQREVKKENDIIKARALPSSKPKEPANLPNEFKTNDDFCPGCGLELRSMSVERTSLWTDVFRENLEPDAAPGKPPRPGLLWFTGWGLEQRLGDDRRALIEGLRKDIETMEKAMPPKYAYVHGVQDIEKPVDLAVHLRGNPNRLGDAVPRGFLSVLSPAASRVTFAKGSGRLDLAKSIAAHPLAIRVFVNRVWKGHFGTGLVNTPSNFGINGERPSHPELLDYLAQYFIDHGMSIKALHREIMRSAVYGLSSENQPAAFAKDSGNRLYWRANLRRMSAEQIRDSVLFVSGALDPKVGGPSVTLTPLADRRTIYGRVSRYKLDEFLQLFDFPSPSQTAEQRFSTNVPLQRLFFMNSDFIQQHAERLADKLADEPDDAARIAKAYRQIFGRAPTPEELKAGRDFLQAEAFKQYEDRKAEAKKKAAEPKKDETSAMPGAKPGAKAVGDKPPVAAADTAAADDQANADGGRDEAPAPDGMMAGVTPGVKTSDDEKKKMLPVTAFGRYVKILLSSNEFLFVN